MRKSPRATFQLAKPRFYAYLQSAIFIRPQKIPQGFTLIEILVSAVIVGILGAGVAAILSSGNTAFVRTRGSNLLEQTIDTDLSQIKDVAFRMTCCSGSCTTGSALSSPCSTDPSTNTFYKPGQQNYYFPDPTLDANESAINSFVTRCNSGTLVSSLTGLMGLSSLPKWNHRDNSIHPKSQAIG
jgi:prepilin-type N-terminal cleavage/methylation domain-containing protein